MFSSATDDTVSEELKSSVNVDVLRLLAARSAEMMACEASLHLATSRAVAPLQRLPVRLRRRAASHQIRRLPRRLHYRPVHATTQKLLTQAKKCRRYRRRPRRLAALAARRALLPTTVASGVKWIPTSLWHAKRFHMVENWGWRLPYAPTDKMFKALQRDTTDRCFMLDLGYMNSFSISGSLGLLKQCLSEVTLPFYVSSVTPDASSESTLPGFHETVALFCCEAAQNRQPTGVASLPNISRPILGPVRILWGPVIQQNEAEPTSTVWLWLHPCMSSEAWKLLSSLDYVSTSSDENAGGGGGGSLRLSDCTGHLCRLKLVGPFAHQVLADLLKQPATPQPDSAGDWPLWQALCEYQKAGLVPCGCGIGLICEPFLKTRPRLKLYNRNWLIPVPEADEVPSRLKGGFVPNSLSAGELAKLKRQLCSPTSNALLSRWFASPEPCCAPDAGIPVLLIQNGTPPLASQKSQCIGWDIVMPRQLRTTSTEDGTTQPTSSSSVDTSAPRDLVISCVYRGVRVGGLRDQLRWATITTEGAGRVDAFPYALWPDTPAARLVTDNHTHLKVGPAADGRLTSDAKRRARIKFRNSAPTSNDWLRLMQSCQVVPEDVQDSFYFVLRDKAMLVLVVRRLLAGDPQARHLTVEHMTRYDPLLPRALIMVKLEAVSRGIPGPRAEIFAPLSTDDLSLGPIAEDPARKLLGFVDEGAYAFSHGSCVAVGFISLAAACCIPLTERLPNGLKVVLFRSSKSGQLHSAKLTVII
uniref:HECT domain-containing protein n=1 Tax=Mesocestoides corti TaxID=53468 RepID=A0A5K3EKB0_MESCO